MTDHTAATRNARLREKKRAVGLIPVTVIIHQSHKEEIKAIAKTMQCPAYKEPQSSASIQEGHES